MHLHSEDPYLYPTLMASRKVRIRELSLQFYREMSSIGNECSLYFEK